jgi:hypothetical protein
MGLLCSIVDNLFDVVKHLPGFRRDRKRQATLRAMLSGDRKWRSIRVLSGAIGADEEHTRDLLVSIGARRSAGEKEVWGLISRVGQG